MLHVWVEHATFHPATQSVVQSRPHRLFTSGIFQFRLLAWIWPPVTESMGTEVRLEGDYCCSHRSEPCLPWGAPTFLGPMEWQFYWTWNPLAYSSIETTCEDRTFHMQANDLLSKPSGTRSMWDCGSLGVFLYITWHTMRRWGARNKVIFISHVCLAVWRWQKAAL